MKILYIYNDYFGRRKRYGKMMSRLGHKVIHYEAINKTKSGSIPTRLLRKYKPDILWLSNPFYAASNKKAMRYCRDNNIKRVVFGTFNVQVPYPKWMWVWKRFDFLFLHNKQCVDYLVAQGLPAYYMPLGFYPSIHMKTIGAKKLNVTFCGRPQKSVKKSKDKRAKYLQGLRSLGLVVYGKDFKPRLKGIPVKSYRGHNDEIRVYANSKINLDLPFVNPASSFYRKVIHFKNRFFEIPATGNFMLTCRHESLLEIFGEDAVGYYDDNPESLKESVKKYLKDKKLRRTMAARAYKIVHSKHSFKHRFKEMFDILEREM